MLYINSNMIRLKFNLNSETVNLALISFLGI
jgi:hypothetical protein